MAKTQWHQVTTAATSRRSLAQAQHVPRGSGANANYLPQMVSSLGAHALIASKSTESTLAMGWMVDPENPNDTYLVVVCKGVAQSEVPNALGPLAWNLGAAKLVVIGAPSGLHAEMAIVRWLCEHLWLGKERLKDGGLQIACIGKKVCKDCGGFMNKHRIKNMSIVPRVSNNNNQQEVQWETTYDYGDASQTWTHPLTGAVYAGGENLNYYRKPGHQSLSPNY